MIFVSANGFGYDLIEYTKNNDIVPITCVVTLSKNAKTKMYDGIDNKCWDELRLPILRIEDINDEINFLKTLNPDFVVIAGWRQIIDKKLLNVFKNRVIGFHPTMLPFGRGKAPIINTILNDIRYSGVTLYYFNETIDGGDIIGQEPFVVEENDYAIDVYRKATNSAKFLIKKFFPMLVNGNAPRWKQDESKVVMFGDPVCDDEDKMKRAFSYPYKLILQGN